MIENYAKYCKPQVVKFLRSLRLDKTFTKAKGDKLWYNSNDSSIEVLDLIGGYGANLFGHNHSELVKEFTEILLSNPPNLVQGSCRKGAGLLAKELCNILGDYMVIFTNSGAETIEATIKHIHLQRKSCTYWALKGAFHGKTLGAIQYNWNYHEPFDEFGPIVEYIDPFNPKEYKLLTGRVEEIGAIFIEPVLGEGGIRPLQDEFLEWLKFICAENKVLLVVDEIQSGMGRTGSFLASQSMGLDPDYICLSKSLGAGLVKIGALLIKKEHYIDDFSIIHTSTFAEDEISSRISLKALQIIKRENLIEQCRIKGEYFLDKLRLVRNLYPDQIKEVRGLGLMIGVELVDHSFSSSNIIRLLSRQKYFGYMAAGYFLNYHGIRIAPTLSQPNTLRIEPSAYISYGDIDKFISGLDQFCRAMKFLDLRHLTGYQIGLAKSKIKDYSKNRRLTFHEDPVNHRKVAFLGNLLRAQDGVLFDKSLDGLPIEKLDEYLTLTSELLGPALFDEVNIHSKTGDVVHLNFIGLNLTAKQIMSSISNGNSGWIIDKINSAANLAKELDCTVMGFGGHTSIVTKNCLKVGIGGIALTSGNSLTIGMGINALKKAAIKKNLDISKSKLGIVGALGNIASVYSELMVTEVEELILIVREGTSSKVISRKINKLKKISPRTKVSIYDNVEKIKDCSLIVAATNSTIPLIEAKHLSKDPKIICDISAPSDVHPNVISERPNTFIINGGLVKLPFNEALTISGIPVKRGHCFGCMAETIIMGLEGIKEHSSFGKINSVNVQLMLDLAEKHGFTVEEPYLN